MRSRGGTPKAGRRARATALALLGATALAFGRTEAQDVNLASAGLGARIIKYTSEAGGRWRAEYVISEDAGAAGWAAADGSLPQEIVVRLPDVARFNALVFALDGGVPEGEWARDVSVYAADPFPTMGGWKLVEHVKLEPRLGEQVFAVARADGRFVRLLITAAQSPGAPRVALGRFKLLWR